MQVPFGKLMAGFRLRLAQKARQTSLRMTARLLCEVQRLNTRPVSKYPSRAEVQIETSE